MTNSDSILNTLKVMVESDTPIPKEEWLNAAFKLNLLRIDETKLLNQMRQAVAKKKLEIIQGQEKRNIAAADAEIESTDEYRFMKDQEDKLWSIEEFIRIAKRNADNY